MISVLLISLLLILFFIYEKFTSKVTVSDIKFPIIIPVAIFFIPKNNELNELVVDLITLFFCDLVVSSLTIKKTQNRAIKPNKKK